MLPFPESLGKSFISLSSMPSKNAPRLDSTGVDPTGCSGADTRAILPLSLRRGAMRPGLYMYEY